MRSTTALILLVLLTVFGAGLWAGNRYTSRRQEDEETPPAAKNGQPVTEIRQGGYRYISPLLECQQESDPENINLRSFYRPIQDLIEKQKKEGAATHVSVYYRDLNNGPWYGIGQDEQFAPASLLKVPVMMTYYKQAESDPSVLEQPITAVQEAFDSGEKRSNLLIVGESYPAGEMIRWMIAKSDNDAFDQLVYAINYDYIKTLLFDLGLPAPDQGSPENYLTVKEYASLFRVLYNASYLNRKMSEQALALMSQTDFNEGLVAGVPAGIQVSHKYGVRNHTDEAEKQLHDCGIVYAPNRPYLLCVMTRGGEIARLTAVIKEISALTYQNVTTSE